MFNVKVEITRIEVIFSLVVIYFIAINYYYTSDSCKAA